MKSTRYLSALVPAFILAGCVSTADRPMNVGENTILSPEVRKMVAESDGDLDTREHERVRCIRERMVGTHMVTRVCYTKAEEEALAKANADKARRFNSRCLDSNSSACNAGLDEPGARSRGPN